MADSPKLPGAQAWKDASGKPLPVDFWRFLRDLSAVVSQASGNTSDLAALLARVAALEDAPAESGSINGPYSVAVFGDLESGAIVQLVNDAGAPGNTTAYGTDATGNKGFFPIADALTQGAGIDLTTGVDGVTDVALDAASIASLALADTAVQPADLTPYALLASPTLATPSLSGLTNAADDTAAAGAGVAIGAVYRNGSILNIRVT